MLKLRRTSSGYRHAEHNCKIDLFMNSSLKHAEKPELVQVSTPLHSEPKFAKGDFVRHLEYGGKPSSGWIGKITDIKWSDKYEQWLCSMVGSSNVYIGERKLTALPSISITIFKVRDGKVEVEEIGDSWLKLPKDEVARMAFDRGYCAILIDDGKTKQRRYCPEIEAIYPAFKGWNSRSFNAKKEVISNIIESEIAKPKWTVESPSGQKLRAYRMKDNVTQIEIDGEIGWCALHPHDLILAALGFNESNIMPYCLHGHE